MAQVKTLGIDIAKNVMCVHGVDTHGYVVVKKRLSRQTLLPFVAPLPPCLIGMEASGGAHYWAREYTKLGHTVKLMSPQFVKPYGVRALKVGGADLPEGYSNHAMAGKQLPRVGIAGVAHVHQRILDIGVP